MMCWSLAIQYFLFLPLVCTPFRDFGISTIGFHLYAFNSTMKNTMFPTVAHSLNYYVWDLQETWLGKCWNLCNGSRARELIEMRWSRMRILLITTVMMVIIIMASNQRWSEIMTSYIYATFCFRRFKITFVSFFITVITWWDTLIHPCYIRIRY